ncbi:class I SAM-dependent methyltransferase [Clostridium botulinum]|uniref:Eco57I restriction-modification methylase domain-containing protein n=1 Tax=Clostridium botulinum TaxID=1491 RepID=UPI0006A72B00|nr:class I SAM-dependent methyltransferase [Clostridium botulinum]KAI3350161.1 class I SAM-dependent methyltransferase [Clostridium botulinum]KOM88973.1 DNA methyltransferase [Clostridium botulinum]KOR63539.1 DNA methyltransferase [Clostridium botulinum]MCS6111557.1 class I SAM-dependent methyltransferase [Clostridium botulinum]NFE10977.1 class I SAM-dependent methyltransferase [Clostridium botulinum]
MLLKEDATTQKLRGAYYTPNKLVKFIVKEFEKDIKNNKIKTILEPSCGDGVFLEELAQIKHIDNVDSILAVEIEEEEAKKAGQKKIKNMKVANDDFIKLYDLELKNKKYDLIIGNPPYIRYQYLNDEQRRVQSDILVKNGMKSNKLINAWVCFLVACIELLNENGSIAFVIPAEILQVAYAEDLRLFISNTLEKITIITFEELVFENIQQEVVVLIGKKNTKKAMKCSKIGVKQLKNLNCLDNLNIKKIEYNFIEHTKEKWTKYFVEDHKNELIDEIKNDNRFTTLGKLGKVNVGITTGSNEYFSVNNEVIKKYELEEVVIPLIGRSAHAHGIYFTREDWIFNVNNNKNAYLIKFPDDIEYENYRDKHKEYIELGEEKEINKGYKCSIRKRWYIVPSIWIPDAFLLRRNSSFPKFVLNDINAVSTDTMHRIKFNEGVQRDKVLLSYYNSITFAYTELNGRSYGGGVLEILPREASNIVLPDLKDFDLFKTHELLKLIDKTIRNDLPIEDLLDTIDKIVLIDYLGVSKETCNEFRNMWKTLMERRHARAK